MDEHLIQKYEEWNIRKQDLQRRTGTDKIYFKERDVWWCAVGINIGSESFGKGEYFRRPVLIIKKLSADLCIGLPMTSKKKDGSWFVDVTLENETSWVILHQIKTFHKKRFQYKIEQLSNNDFIRVKEKLKTLLEFPKYYHSADAEIEGITPKSTISISDDISGSQ